MGPADSDTMLTAVEDRGTTFVTRVWTKHYDHQNDQLLYRAADNVTWVYPELFSQFVPRFGGMHMLMSFIGCVGNNDLEDVKKYAFASVAQTLGGKKLPQNK